MSKRAKAITALIMSLIMAAGCLTGCGASDGGNVEDAGKIVSETDSSLTVIDQAGREVTVRKDPQTMAFCYRVAARFLISLDQGDKIKGMGKTEEFLEEVEPSLKDCADVGKGVADIEALAELNPDLFIHKASDVETLEAVEEIGIPAVGIEVETTDDMLVAIDLLGKVCGAEEKADRLIAFYEEIVEKTTAKSEKISNRKKAIVMGSSIGKVADGTMLQGEMLVKAGAENCAEDIEATELWPTAGTEQIFVWNPDYIFITNGEGRVYDSSDICGDKSWSEIEAVRNKNVLVMPAKKDSWELPGISTALGIEYMMRTMYPELISDEELEEDVNRFYKLAYGKEFTREELGY